ncbi:DUF1330 domain-containing protein [Paracoccus methylovorus]|uniref:DUF1330 domain-containing protein n=1 Tax=Paracoccus methylovorus TaxID=2812658 RepID=A0ABX7JNS3_9RHOB|nr:DUF1330 domain-containing protein [Paracoccus methylovorus]QRZ15151.1 DUF1330 domain-containing protein [Paracoccus methylovorus]
MLKKLALGLALSAMTLPALAQQADQPAYLVATLEVADLAAYFDRYGGPLFPMLAAAGAEVLVGTPTVETLEGDYAATWTAIVRFPSMEALSSWYASDEYQAIAPERRALSDAETSVLFAAPGFVMPAQ